MSETRTTPTGRTLLNGITLTSTLKNAEKLLHEINYGDRHPEDAEIATNYRDQVIEDIRAWRLHLQRGEEFTP